MAESFILRVSRIRVLGFVINDLKIRKKTHKNDCISQRYCPKHPGEKQSRVVKKQNAILKRKRKLGNLIDEILPNMKEKMKDAARKEHKKAVEKSGFHSTILQSKTEKLKKKRGFRFTK